MTATLPVDTDNMLTTLVEGARALVPALVERADETDELRRLPDATVDDIRALGILGMAAPTEVGGNDLGPVGILEVSMALAGGCAATAWCAGNWAVHNILTAMLQPEAQQEVYANGMPIVSTGFSPLRAKTEKVDGGQRITGQWDFASGVDHAEWVVVMAMSETGPLAHLVPRADLEIIDTWHTTGLRGTGSNDVAAADLFVPEHRLLPMGPPGEGQSIGRGMYASPWLRLSLNSVFGAGVIGTVLGTAQATVDEFVRRQSGLVGGLSGVKVSDRPEIHYLLGESVADVEGATARMRASYAEQHAVALSGRESTMEERLRWRRDAAWCGKIATAAADRLYAAGGAHVLYTGDRIERQHRDITAGSHHYGLNWDSLFIGTGRVLAGGDLNMAMI
ncbi:acyl-CoA dehydrogenase family protein [soil metagenome]